MAIWPIKGGMSELIAQLPDAVRESVALMNEGEIPSVGFDVVLSHGNEDALELVPGRISGRHRRVLNVPVMSHGSVDIPLEALVTDSSGTRAPASAEGARDRRRSATNRHLRD